MNGILVIGGHHNLTRQIYEGMTNAGHEPILVSTLNRGLSLLQSDGFDLVFLSSRIPDGNSLEALPLILAVPYQPQVIVLADGGDADEAENAIRLGAWDYWTGVPSREWMEEQIIQVINYKAETKRNWVHREIDQLAINGIIGRSHKIKVCIDNLSRAAKSDAPVLLTGETGTGKEVFAQAIHDNSPRARGNFIVLDCAALPETLVESTLFGHTRGAYTGATGDQDGLLKQADGGTLFLDEVGELPLSVQTRFLRVLDEKAFRPVGGKNEVKSDFRLVAATNQNLDEMVEKGHFRQDLLFRLRTFCLDLPPLRERMEDLEELVNYHLAELIRNYGLSEKTLSSDFLEDLTQYDWPGNIRELVNALERALVSAQDEPILYAVHLPTHIRVHLVREEADEDSVDQDLGSSYEENRPLPTLQEVRESALAHAEKNYLEELMGLTSGDIRSSCQLAGLSRSRLYALMRKHGVSRY